MKLAALILALALVPRNVLAEDPPPSPSPQPNGAGPNGTEENEWQPATWGEFDPGQGFRVANTKLGDLWISGYALGRWLDQLPSPQTYTDHLGRVQDVPTRNDIHLHRVLLFFRGWVFAKKFEYNITVWTVNSAEIIAVIGALTYRFHKAFNLNVGVDGMPGIRSLVGSHPYWLGHDRTMAEETMRPGFTNALWATGEVLPGLFYKVTFGNNISQLGLSASELTRDFAYGASIWWMPTTKEFGPRGAFGDWEYHKKLATRFGMSSVRAIEDHYTPLDQPPGSTQIRLADGMPLFATGALAPNVTLQKATYWILSADAGFKFKGLFLQAEYSARWLYDFQGNGPVPVQKILDHSFYVQAAGYPIPKWWELYAGTSMVFGDRAAGFSTNWEVYGGTNVYFAKVRNLRLNGHFIYVDHSSAGGSFGYYSQGEKGPIVAIAASVFF
jgi:hypothetical protein